MVLDDDCGGLVLRLFGGVVVLLVVRFFLEGIDLLLGLEVGEVGLPVLLEPLPGRRREVQCELLPLFQVVLVARRLDSELIFGHEVVAHDVVVLHFVRERQPQPLHFRRLLRARRSRWQKRNLHFGMKPHRLVPLSCRRSFRLHRGKLGKMTFLRYILRNAPGPLAGTTRRCVLLLRACSFPRVDGVSRPGFGGELHLFLEVDVGGIVGQHPPLPQELARRGRVGAEHALAGLRGLDLVDRLRVGLALLLRLRLHELQVVAHELVRSAVHLEVRGRPMEEGHRVLVALLRTELRRGRPDLGSGGRLLLRVTIAARILGRRVVGIRRRRSLLLRVLFLALLLVGFLDLVEVFSKLGFLVVLQQQIRIHSASTADQFQAPQSSVVGFMQEDFWVHSRHPSRLLAFPEVAGRVQKGSLELVVGGPRVRVQALFGLRDRFHRDRLFAHFCDQTQEVVLRV
mmetsp:Transcript_22690/g.57487  ORF Transcript_22690/g.57487 Transcript_22690/m.57487 type:complete len:456 (-) Transcript_22690:1734-3101(-)